MRSKYFKICCIRDGLVSRTVEVKTISNDGTPDFTFTGCALLDGSASCARFHGVMQDLLDRNPGVDLSDLAEAFSALQSAQAQK